MRRKAGTLSSASFLDLESDDLLDEDDEDRDFGSVLWLALVLALLRSVRWVNGSSSLEGFLLLDTDAAEKRVWTKRL